MSNNPDGHGFSQVILLPMSELVNTMQFPHPPPIPPNGAPILALPTITLMIAITFLLQGCAIAFSTRAVKQYQGVREVFLATLSLALGFGMLLLRFRIGVHLTGVLSNSFVIAGHVLIYIAIYRFIDKPLDNLFIYGLIPLCYLVLMVIYFLPPSIPIILITQVVSFPLDIASAWALHKTNNSRYKLSAYLTAIPLLIYGFASIFRLLTGIVSPAQVVPGPTLSTLADVLLLYILSFLWTAGFILMISQRLQSNLNDLAMKDALTRIWNRRAMQDKLEFEMRQVKTGVRDFSVILIDVDRFKSINDLFGHDVGDIVLQWLAATLQFQLRVHDIVARWGGEEFLILLPDTSLEEALQIAERLRISIADTPVDGVSDTLHITISGGVANSRNNRDVPDLIKLADQAVYIAKETRNKMVSQHSVFAR